MIRWNTALVPSACIAVALASPQLVQAQAAKGKLPNGRLSKAVAPLKADDGKLKTTYQETVRFAKHLVEVNATLVAINTQLLSTNLSSDQRSQLRNNQQKLEGEQKNAQNEVEKKQAAFKDSQQALLDKLNSTLAPEIKALGKDATEADLDDLTNVLGMFVFEDLAEIPAMKNGASFLDQEVWKEAVDCFAATGTNRLPSIKRALKSKLPAAKYAAAAALAEIGPAADKADKDLFDEVFKMNALVKKAALDKTEKEARQRVTEKTLDAIRPDRKK
jgi:hypothetical protein